jgi:hypothetical protein
VTRRYETETFGCSRCGRRLPGKEFHRGNAGSAISQPCKDCRSASRKAATRERRIAQGRSPYHLLSAVDPERRTAVCRECGPTHIYATGAASGRGWRCGTRSDDLSDAWYEAKASVIDKFAAARWHRVRDISGTAMRGVCSLCGDVPVRWSQSGGYFVCASPARKRQHADAERRRRRAKQYGLSPGDYEQMLAAQDGRCAICGGTQGRADSDGALVVDHDHETGRVRALLCGLCNVGLGSMREDPAILRAAIQYLERHQEPDLAVGTAG